MSKICLAFLGLLALLVLVQATEDEEEVSLTEGNTISREIRDAGMSRPKKGKYKRPGERKGRRAKKKKKLTTWKFIDRNGPPTTLIRWQQQ